MKRKNEDIAIDNILSNFEELNLISREEEYENLKKSYEYVWNDNNEIENRKIVELAKKRFKKYMIYIDIDNYNDLECSINRFFQEGNMKKKYIIMKEADMIILSLLKMEGHNTKKNKY